MIPTGRLVLLVALPVALGAVAFAQPSVAVPMIAADVVIGLVALIDWMLNRGELVVEREFAPVQAVGRAFPVTLRIRAAGRRALRLRLTDQTPDAAEGLPVAMRLPTEQTVEVTYQATVHRRGEHRFGQVTARWRSPLGLFERQVRLPIADSVRVYPSFRQLRTWGLLAREDERRLPVRIRRKPGGENEFERLRPYVAGDAYRHIDWRATARRASLITRQFGQESNQNVIFLIDAGRMMSAKIGELTAFDHALDAALMMGQVALRHGDRVGLLVYDDQIRAWHPPRGGARSGSGLIRATYDLFPSLREPDHALALRWLAHRVKRRSLVVVLSTVVDQVNADTMSAIVRAMSSRHLPLTVWIRDVELESLVSGPRRSGHDHYVAGAAAELLAARERQLDALRKRGALVVDASPADLTPRLLSRYLEIKAQRLL